MAKEVDQFISRQKNWKAESVALREMLLSCDLEENIKWGKPCYSQNSNNIAIIQSFKDNCALMFFKGCLLQDPEGFLEKPGKNSETARRIMFQNVSEIQDKKQSIQNFIQQAIVNENTGKKIRKVKKELELPNELKEVLLEDSEFKTAFEALTPGRQRSYVLYISQAKQSQTRKSRAEKSKSKVLMGKGYNER